jgi:hypothetical protein
MLNQYRSTLSGVVNEHPLLGMAMTHHRNLRGGPMSFRDKPYLIELYTDCPTTEDGRIRKAVQTGVSELMIQLALHHAGWNGRIVGYVLPTFKLRDRFVQRRVDPLLERIAAYRERVPGADRGGKSKKAGNLQTKRFGAGALLFLGSNTSSDFVEFSADTLIIDEYDKCDPVNLALAQDRLRESPYPQMIQLGNPTLPNVGISRLYDEGDRRRWFSRCDHCNERQPIDWFGNVIRRDDDSGAWVPRDIERAANAAHGGPDIRPVCRRCRRPFVRTGLSACWVPEDSSGTVPKSWWMSRLDVLSDSLWKLYQEWLLAQGNPIKLAAFYCSVLGIPFEFAGARLDRAILERAATGASMDRFGGEEYGKCTVTAGVDVGGVINCSISVVEAVEGQDEPHRRSVLIQAFRTFEELEDTLRRFRVDVCVIDEMPETRKCQELRDSFINSGGCTVWMCRFYPTARAGALPYGMKPKWRTQQIQVDRTAVFDVSHSDIVEGRRQFPEDVFNVLGWQTEMCAPVRVLNEEKGRIIWHEGSAPDHFRLADVYDRVAFDMLQMGGTYSAM